MATNPALMELHLGGNRIGDVGATALATALATNMVLTGLYLHRITISNVGIKALAAALATNTALKTLGLLNNAIGDAGKGKAALVEGLAVNTTLTLLQYTYELFPQNQLDMLTNRNARFAELCCPMLQLMCATQCRRLFVPAEIWSNVRWALVSLCEAPAASMGGRGGCILPVVDRQTWAPY